MRCKTNALQIRAKNSVAIRLRIKGMEYAEGDKFYLTIKQEPDNDSTDSEAVLAKDWTYGEDAELDSKGWLVLKLDKTETDIPFTGIADQPYFYDIKIVTTYGASDTLVFGQCVVLPSITLRA